MTIRVYRIESPRGVYYCASRDDLDTALAFLGTDATYTISYMTPDEYNAIPATVDSATVFATTETT